MLTAMTHPDDTVPGHAGALTVAWNSLTAALGVVMGLAPHVLHHVGLLAGAGLVSGLAGNLAFALVGLLLSIPMLRRLYRRFGTWKAPTIAVLIFAAMFTLSAVVIGPAISGTSSTNQTPGPSGPSRTPAPEDHTSHHSG
jgi:predicted PurR-regulated permease PerM